MIIPQKLGEVNPANLRIIIDQVLDSEPDPRVRCCRCGRLVRFDYINGIGQDSAGNPLVVCGVCSVYGAPDLEVNTTE